MVLYLAERLAKQLMEQHHVVPPWKFEFDNAKRRFGLCNYTDKIISISQHLVLLNDEPEVRNVILHEIAHVLCPGDGHNWYWKMRAQSIGCDGERCYSDDEVETPETKYVAYCGRGHKFGRMQLAKKNYVCTQCRVNHGDKTVLVYKENPLFIKPVEKNFAKFFRK